MVIKDLNEIGAQWERGGARADAVRNIEGFHDLPFELELMVAEFNGQRYTWSNKREGKDRIRERLDKALVNTNWLRMFQVTQALVDLAIGSYHSPLVVDTDWVGIKGKKLSKFESVWLESDSCEEVIRKCWKDRELSRISEVVGVPEEVFFFPTIGKE